MMQARSAAFVVEQNCVFLDIDGIDPECWHLLGHDGATLVATARLVPPGTKFAEPSIGRVVTTNAVRGTGVGRLLMREAIAQAERLWPHRALRVAAQQHLEKFYTSLGFARTSEPYIEDGIPHIDMLRPPSAVPDRRGQTVGQ